MNPNPLVSVLIVTWNRRDDVLETLRAIHAQPYRPFEIVLVDNGSTDGTVDAVREAYPESVLVALDRNTGPTGGRNAGMIAAHGDIIFCLDSDASPGPDTLASIVDCFQADPQLGIINSKIVNAYTGQIDHTAGWSYTEKDREDQDRPFLSYSFSEGGAAIRREVVAQVGGFWEALFFGREGQDYSIRTWDAGYKVLYWPESVVYHRVSPHRRIEHEERLYYDLRNAMYIYLVRYPWWMALVFVPLKLGTSLVKGLRRRCLGQVGVACRDVVRAVPMLMRERRPIKSETARRYWRLQREHGPLRWDLLTWLRYKT